MPFHTRNARHKPLPVGTVTRQATHLPARAPVRRLAARALVSAGAAWPSRDTSPEEAWRQTLQLTYESQLSVADVNLLLAASDAIPGALIACARCWQPPVQPASAFRHCSRAARRTAPSRGHPRPEHARAPQLAAASGHARAVCSQRGPSFTC